jgi:putative flavoprotein involved in K+ transport
VTALDGIYVLGLPWLWTWGSGRFLAVGRDAEHVVGQLADRLAATTALVKQAANC